ncbi:hypothetical protein GS534_24290 [Rhodococcus hoagii]|nr:hypothetical protein [Prescottella equi]NKS33150.1 hypothetical protein [Prescottella equi]
MSRPIRVAKPADPHAVRHAFRGPRAVCGRALLIAEKASATKSLEDVSCSTCRLILSANPTTNWK